MILGFCVFDTAYVLCKDDESVPAAVKPASFKKLRLFTRAFLFLCSLLILFSSIASREYSSGPISVFFYHKSSGLGSKILKYNSEGGSEKERRLLNSKLRVRDVFITLECMPDLMARGCSR